MTTNLPANLETISEKELMILTGQIQEQDGIDLPTLRVNYDDEDADGNKIPRGAWSIYAEDGTRVFADTVRLRPIHSVYQYSHYDADKQELVSKSVFFQSFSDQVPDTTGGFRCGKVKRKEVDKLSIAEQETQKKIKLSKVIFGLISVDGKDPKGNEKSIVDMPCVFYAKGSNFIPMTEFMQNLGCPMQQVEVTLGLSRKKNGGVVYWEVVPTFDKNNKLPVTKEVFALIRKFGDTITAENDAIMEKHRSIRAKGVSPQMRSVAELISMNEASTDLSLKDDEIPF